MPKILIVDEYEPEQPTVAEALLQLARAIKQNPGKLVLDFPEHMCQADALARADLALRFEKLPPDVRFRAMVENWTFSQCKQQVF